MKILKNYTGRQRLPIKKYPKTLTQQSHVGETDINHIMSKAQRTGLMPMALSERKAQFGDFSQIASYHDAQNAIIHAREQFEQIPAETRKLFDNDPQKLIEFLANEDNYEEAVKLGLCQQRLPQQEETSLHPTKEEEPTEE